MNKQFVVACIAAVTYASRYQSEIRLAQLQHETAHAAKQLPQMPTKLNHQMAQLSSGLHDHGKSGEHKPVVGVQETFTPPNAGASDSDSDDVSVDSASDSEFEGEADEGQTLENQPKLLAQ